MNQISDSSNIIVTIEDKDNFIMAGVQSYSAKCDIDYEKVGAMGEVQPTDYNIKGRTYTVTLKRVFLLNTSLTDKRSIYDKYHWKDFEVAVEFNGVDGGKSKTYRYRNCYRVEATQDVDIDGNPMSETVTILSHNCGYESDDTEYKRLKKMVYGSFVFPYNPTSTEFSSDRKYVEHKFPGLKYNDIEDFGPNCSVISCEGKFFGSGCLKQWNKLLSEYKKKGVKKTYHPIWSSIDKSLMIDLKGVVNEGKMTVDYTFTLIEYDPVPPSKNKKSKGNGGSGGSTGKKKSSQKKKTGKVKSKNDLKVGNSVYITGVCCHDSNGGKPHSKKYDHKKMVITKVHSSGSHPIHLGSVGWAKVSDLSWS